ncbi:MAG: aminopeptidase P family protein [Actinomycetes bacterium]
MSELVSVDQWQNNRVLRVRKLLGEQTPVQAILLSDLHDIRWISGFSGSSGWLLITEKEMWLFTDGRYTEQASSQINSTGVMAEVVECRTQTSMLEAVAQRVKSMSGVWFQSAHTTFDMYQTLKIALAVDLLPAPISLGSIRRLKDPGELALIEKACRIADQALHEVLPMLLSEPSEIDVRDQLEFLMRQLGADGPSYDTIVATGPINSARPHHSPTSTSIQEGHTLIIDVGALVEGYHSDMTRSFVIGDMNQEQLHAYQAVLEAQAAGVALIGPGVATRDVDALCRKVLTEAGLGEMFNHGTGHGVGLLIHEDPYLNSSSTAILQAGDVVTVEPGVYRGGFGGLRIEDLVVVTESCSRTLNTSPKEPTCPPSPQTI